MVAVAEWEPKNGTYVIYNEAGFCFEELKDYRTQNGNLRFGIQAISLDEFWRWTWMSWCPLP